MTLALERPQTQNLNEIETPEQLPVLRSLGANPESLVAYVDVANGEFVPLNMTIVQACEYAGTLMCECIDLDKLAINV